MHREKHKEDLEKGDSVLGFAAVIPAFIMILGVTGILAWIFWSQGAASMLAAESTRLGGLNRGDAVAPGAGLAVFEDGLASILGARTGGLVGSPGTWTNISFRQVGGDLGDTHMVQFGIFSFPVVYGGGGTARMHLFFPGPPDPWE